MPRLLPSYLHTLRKQWGLSQPDLAALFDVTGSAMSRFENMSRQPTVELVIGAEVIFGQSARNIFPALYHEIEGEIVARAQTLRDSLPETTSAGVRKKMRLLTKCIERGHQIKLAL